MALLFLQRALHTHPTPLNPQTPQTHPLEHSEIFLGERDGPHRRHCVRGSHVQSRTHENQPTNSPTGDTACVARTPRVAGTRSHVSRRVPERGQVTKSPIATQLPPDCPPTATPILRQFAPDSSPIVPQCPPQLLLITLHLFTPPNVSS